MPKNRRGGEVFAMSKKTVLVDVAPPVALKGDDGTRFIYNLLPVGRFFDKRYGEIWVHDEMLQKMEANFGKYPAYEVPVKIGHGDGALSPGEVIAISAKSEGLEITMMVDAETAEAINKKQYRYMSAEFDENYVDKETNEPVGAVLLGAALVNQPANPYMEPLVLADDIHPGKTGGAKPDNGRNGNMDPVELLQKKLSEAEEREKKAREELEASIQESKTKEAEAQQKIAELEAEKKALAEERAKVAHEKLETEVKAFCDEWPGKGVPPVVLEKVKPVLLSEGRVIKLSDKEDAPLIKVFGEVFEAMAKVPMGQQGRSDAPSTELSDIEKAKKLGEQIAASVGVKVQ